MRRTHGIHIEQSLINHPTSLSVRLWVFVSGLEIHYSREYSPNTLVYVREQPLIDQYIHNIDTVRLLSPPDESSSLEKFDFIKESLGIQFSQIFDKIDSHNHPQVGIIYDDKFEVIEDTDSFSFV